MASKSLLFLSILLLFLSLSSLPFISSHDDENDMMMDEEGDMSGGDIDELSSSVGEDDAPPAEIKPEVEVQTVPYSPPSTTGLMFAELFDGDVFSRWVKSADPKFSGRWEKRPRAVEAIVGDFGIRVMDAAKHHAIATTLPSSAQLINNLDKGLVISYEAKFEDDLNCGGAYMKLFNSKGLSNGSLEDFNNETPYVVMFGPDRCGTTNKVHLIIKQKNPKSGEWVEHHLKTAPRVPFGKGSHTYTFQLKPDNTYSVLIDGVAENTGSLASDFEPPFTPSEEIDDSEDTKPDNWVDDEKITDPSATKPEDWDEDAPKVIPDSSAKLPEGWLEEEELMVKDESAVMPDTWDAEEDGEWTAPLISNPLCKEAAGCGPWSPPMIANPQYKGKWIAPLIDNPLFKGEWKPRKIPNPHFFTSENPHALADIDSLGFELWTMQEGILFDNIVVARELEPVNAFIQNTWKIRSEIEKLFDAKKGGGKTPASPQKGDGVMAQILLGTLLFANSNPILFGIAVVVILLAVVMFVISLFKKSPLPAPEVPTPSTKESAKEKDKKEKTEESEKSEAAEESEAEQMEEKETPGVTTRQRTAKASKKERD